MIAPISGRLAGTLVLGLALLLGAGVMPAAHAATPPPIKTSGKTVALTLIASLGSTQGGFNFNGGANGKLTITVPLGDKVNVTFSNMGPVMHSAQIVAYSKTPPTSAVSDAFKGAHTPNPMAGTAKGVKQTFSFVANKAGTYMLICAVPGHAAAGMWDYFVVSKTAKAASMVLKK
jgi:sulfocyanin